MRRFLFFCICWLGVTAAIGQHASDLGRFEIDEIKGCAPFTVNITNTFGQCNSTFPCNMDFETNGTTVQNSLSYTYNTPGKYTLTVYFQAMDPSADQIEIEVVENNDPTFEVYSCLGNDVTIKITDKSHDTYIIDFNDDGIDDTTIPMGNNATAVFSYDTPPPGPTPPHTIAVRGRDVGAADNCRVLKEDYTPPAAILQPSINVMTAVDANNLSLEMTTAPQVLNKLEIAINNSTTFQDFADIYEQTNATVPSLLIDENFYCFRLSSVDPCMGTNQPGATICSQDFDAQFLNGINQLDWKTTGSISSIDINRNGAGYAGNLGGGTRSYGDADYDCNKEYCYQIVSHYGSATSYSLLKCGTGILETTFPAIENISSVVRAGVELTWTADPTIDIKAFDVLKSVPGGALRQYAVTETGLYIDGAYDYSGGTCYQVNYGDFCNNRSGPGIVACPMALSGVMDERNAVTLTWNSYKGYRDGVTTYEVQKFNQSGVLLGVFPTTDTTFVDFDPADNEQVVNYSIEALAVEPGVNKSVSNVITIEKPVRLILPTAFTPNGDGVNPLFTISGKFVSKVTIQIFDRWGVLVFKSDNNEPWDGTKAGRVMPESAYVWKAEVEDFAGNVFTREGTVLLLRPPR